MIRQDSIDAFFVKKFNHGSVLDYEHEDDIYSIKNTIAYETNIKLSAAEAFYFWQWRSQQAGGSWLKLGERHEIRQWFIKFCERFNIDMEEELKYDSKFDNDNTYPALSSMQLSATKKPLRKKAEKYRISTKRFREEYNQDLSAVETHTNDMISNATKLSAPLRVFRGNMDCEQNGENVLKDEEIKSLFDDILDEMDDFAEKQRMEDKK